MIVGYPISEPELEINTRRSGLLKSQIISNPQRTHQIEQLPSSIGRVDAAKGSCAFLQVVDADV